MAMTQVAEEGRLLDHLRLQEVPGEFRLSSSTTRQEKLYSGGMRGL
jgi:hypothetical protein